MARKSSLSGAEKAAVLLISLGDTIAAKVMGNLDEKEIQQIGNFMSFMESVESETLTDVTQEFYESLETGEGGMLAGGREYLKKMLSKSLDPEKAEEILGKITALGSGEELEMGGGLEAVKHLDALTVANFLRNEHPQTVAIIMAHADPTHAAEILKVLPERFQSDIIFRMATLERVSPTVLKEIDQALAMEFQSAAAMEGSTLGGVEAVAEVVNALDHNLEVNILSDIESTHPELAENIRKLMFVFEDLIHLDNRGMQSILKEIANEDLLLAMKTSSEGLRNKLFANMSQRAAEMLKEDLSAMGPTRLSDVEKAQQSIIRVVKKLEEEGKIVLASGGEEFV